MSKWIFLQSKWENIHGKINIKGPHGINGPYKDIDVIMKPDENSKPWEGLQGVDSLSNPYIAADGKYCAFYGSALTQDQPCCQQRVGLAVSQDGLYGEWMREPYPAINPSNLTIPNNSSEQPIDQIFRWNIWCCLGYIE